MHTKRPPPFLVILAVFLMTAMTALATSRISAGGETAKATTNWSGQMVVGQQFQVAAEDATLTHAIVVWVNEDITWNAEFVNQVNEDATMNLISGQVSCQFDWAKSAAEVNCASYCIDTMIESSANSPKTAITQMMSNTESSTAIAMATLWMNANTESAEDYAMIERTETPSKLNPVALTGGESTAAFPHGAFGELPSLGVFVA